MDPRQHSSGSQDSAEKLDLPPSSLFVPKFTKAREPRPLNRDGTPMNHELTRVPSAADLPPLTLHVYDWDGIASRDDDLGELGLTLERLRTVEAADFSLPLSTQGSLEFRVCPRRLQKFALASRHDRRRRPILVFRTPGCRRWSTPSMK